MSSALPIGAQIEGVQVRFWAGAKSAAGRSEMVVAPGSARQILIQLRSELGESFYAVAATSTLLLDGVALHDLDRPLCAGSTLEILPPFAGG
ncbi:MAG: MoaD/ThiS family protein [Actinomycetes bacterium]